MAFSFYDQNRLPGAQNAFGAQPTTTPQNAFGAPPSGQNTLPGSQQGGFSYFDPNALGGGGSTGTPGTSGFSTPGKGNRGAQPNSTPTGATPGGETLTGEGVLSGPGYEEEFYKKHGMDLMDDPSASERLFDMGVAGSNPYYDFAQEQAIKAINDSAAARGGFNSSYTQNLIGKTVADIRGQQAHELNMLANQSDQGRFGRYDRSNEYARGAQRATEDRVKGAGNAYSDLADKQAGRVEGFYRTAQGGMTAAQMAAIEAELKKSGLKAEEIKQIMGLFGEGIGAIGKAVG